MFSLNKWTNISLFFICVKTTIHGEMFDAHAFNGGLSGCDVLSSINFVSELYYILKIYNYCVLLYLMNAFVSLQFVY